MRFLSLYFTVFRLCTAQSSADPYSEFLKWRQANSYSALKWEQQLQKYSAKLKSDGFKDADVARIVDVVTARDEGTFYDQLYKQAPKFDTAPNRLLVEAVKNRIAGRALDVDMGQGRNAIYLAKLGWRVTGFDVSKVGLDEAQRLSKLAGVSIRTILASDEEFDFGTEQWDLVAILYPLEKRSVHHVRQALRRGGIVVVECGHKEAGNQPFEFETNELLKIFEGFRILKYEDTMAMHDWARKEMRMVRLIAEKQ